MADSQRLAIRKSVQAALQAMSVAGGYHWDVKPSSVVRDPVSLLTVAATETPFFVLGETEPMNRTFFPAMEMEDAILLRLYARVDAPGLEANRKDDAFENLIADIEKALTVDITRGQNAIDTRLHQPEASATGLPNQNMVLVMQPIEIRTHRQYGQP